MNDFSFGDGGGGGDGDHDVHLAAIQSGDADAFGRWVARTEATLRASLGSFAAFVDTEAVVQESLLRVWQVAPRFERDGRPNGLLRLALRIARNLAISERRKVRTDFVDDDEIDERAFLAAGAPVTTDPLLRRLIEECRRLLPDKPMQALLARLGAAGSEPDELLAERLAMRLNTFLQNFTRARKLLASCLRGRGVEIEAEP
jgi:RNA polymerase sigma-70 factor (ECF subfamily)